MAKKTNKSFKKRLKVTGTGKVLRRKPRGNHYNAKESRSKQLDRKREEEFNLMDKRNERRFLPHKKDK